MIGSYKIMYYLKIQIKFRNAVTENGHYGTSYLWDREHEIHACFLQVLKIKTSYGHAIAL